MMMMKKNIFYIQSDFQYIICKNIIVNCKLNPKDCYFACGRGMTVEYGDQKFEFYDSNKTNIWKRIRCYISNRKKMKSFFKDCDVVMYLPFSLYYPRIYFFKDYIFYEEGLSSYYSYEIERSYKFICMGIYRYIITYLLFPFSNSNIKGYLMWSLFSRTNPLRKTYLITCSRESYKYRSHHYLCKQVLPITKISIDDYDIPRGSYIIILDRFSPYGRTSSIEAYRECVKKMFNYGKERGAQIIWTKLHPADYDNPNALNALHQCLEDMDVKIAFFEGRLDFLASQDKGIHFIATNSTILYYAPVFGKTNVSISFAKYLASIDESYRKYLQLYGGVDAFIEFFSKNVNCL